MATRATSSRVLACYFFNDICPAMAGDKARQQKAIDGLIALTRAMGIMGDFHRDVMEVRDVLAEAAKASRRKPVPPPARKDREADEDAMRGRLMEYFAAPVGEEPNLPQGPRPRSIAAGAP